MAGIFIRLLSSKSRKMKNRSWICILPFLLLACAKPTQFDYIGVSNLKVLQFGIKESTVRLDVVYYNPNKYPLTMKSADVDVYVEDNYLGKAILDSTIHIPGRDTFYLPVLLRVNTVNMTGGLLQSMGREEEKIKLEGKARVGRGIFFITYPIKYEGMQKLKV